MSQVIDDRHEDWFRFVMEAVDQSSTDKKWIAEMISAEMHGKSVARQKPPFGEGDHGA
jgi:hypothetical protein